MDDLEIAQLVFALVKIALMLFSVLHIMFLIFILRRIHSMQKQLSTLRQWSLEALLTLTVLGLILLLIYIILLP